MIIDFHTHAFPDKIAAGAIKVLEGNGKIKANTDGTVMDLQKKTKESGIDYSLVLPVVTSPKQTKSINDFAIKINFDNDNYPNVLSFGGMHPDYDLFEEELIRIKESGLKGIKLHPEYQNTYIDDDKYVRIIDKAFELGLIVIIHAGIDIGIDSDLKASPDRILNCKSKLKNNGIFVLAHMGSWKMWNEVYDKILGNDFYIDTAFSLGDIYKDDEKIEMLKENDVINFINKHQADKILFGTDSPWAKQKEYVNFMNKLNISKNDLNKIMGLNAKKLLNL